MYKISIILAVYNAEDKLFKAFESILNQTIGFENLEVIFVDDNSTDNSLNVIRGFADKYENVKAISLSENSGYCGKPRNVGIENSTSDYLMFLDSDDYYLDNACEILYDAISQSECDFVSGNYIQHTSYEDIYRNWEWCGLKDNEIAVDSIFENTKLLLIPPLVWAKIFNKKFILDNDITFPVGIPAQDIVFISNCFIKAKGIKFVDIPVITYCVGEDDKNNTSITSVQSKKLLSGFLKAYYMEYEIYKDYPELVGFVANNLHYWTEQFAVSKISQVDKIDLLIFAYPLFELFRDLKMHPRPNFEKFYEKVYEKDFIAAIKLSEEIAISLDRNKFNLVNDIRCKNYIFIINMDEINSDIFNFAGLLNENDYDVKIISLDSPDTFDRTKFKEFNNVENVFDYYCGGLKVLRNDNDEKISLYENVHKFNMDFEDFDELKKYFITETCLNYPERPFLIYNNLNMDINDSIAHIIDLSKDNRFNQIKEENLLDYEFALKDVYVEDLKAQHDYQNDLISNIERLSKLNKKLEKKNRKLSKQEKINKELLNSTSWRITAPLRKIVSIFRR